MSNLKLYLITNFPQNCTCSEPLGSLAGQAHTHTHTHRDRDRDTDRERQRKTDRDKDGGRDRDSKKDREKFSTNKDLYQPQSICLFI